MPDDEGRVAHHVVEHPTSLEVPAPEPGAVWAAVLLGRPGEVRAAGRGRAACPQQGSARLDLGREDLVLEVAVRQPDAPNELDHLFRFCNVAGKRFLACNALERPLAG